MFYLKNANDDGYSPIVQESETEAATLPDVEITLEQMISTGKSFLEKNGYIVTLACDAQPEVTTDPKGLRELAPMVEKLRTMISAHFSTHALIEEGHTVLDAIKAKI